MGCPAKWKHGLKPAVPWWFNFDPHLPTPNQGQLLADLLPWTSRRAVLPATILPMPHRNTYTHAHAHTHTQGEKSLCPSHLLQFGNLFSRPVTFPSEHHPTKAGGPYVLSTRRGQMASEISLNSTPMVPSASMGPASYPREAFGTGIWIEICCWFKGDPFLV